MGLQLLHLHLHGLIRSHDLELGRDADTGGQTLYVSELIKELAAFKQVEKVDLITRLIQDRRLSLDYSQPVEHISPKAQIIRIPFGPKRYIKKELFWPYLDGLAQLIIKRLQQRDKLPDWIHAHYADAGYVGSLVSSALDIPFVFTGHSLGREKKRQLLGSGMTHDQIEKNYSITRRIEAEELALATANLIVTSTEQESKTQYARYRNFSSVDAKVIEPGVDLKKFHPIQDPAENFEIDQLFSSFLRKPSLPPLLAISRAVKRKNVPALLEVFGRSSFLRSRYNLILILGNRDDVRQLDKQQKDVFQEIFEIIDNYNLYGHVALPKNHTRNQIPKVYRWAASRKGLFINPALTEPFGLTLIEAAACGLPMVATNDGGPSEILSKCSNGMLVDVSDLDLFQKTLEKASSNQYLWNHWSKNALEGISNHFSWKAHVSKYISLMTSKKVSNLLHFSSIKAS